jgi:hypothetical protein
MRLRPYGEDSGTGWTGFIRPRWGRVGFVGHGTPDLVRWLFGLDPFGVRKMDSALSRE